MPKEYKGTKYPHEIFAAVRQQTFYVNSELSLATAADGLSPMMVYNDTFSRFVFNIINKDRIATWGNISVDEMDELAFMTKYIRWQEMQMKYAPEQPKEEPRKEPLPKPDSPAYNVQITIGRFAGKTPAEIVAITGGNRDELNSLYRELKEELRKGIKVQHQIDAVSDAAALLKEGKIDLGLGNCDAAWTVKFTSGKVKGKTPAEAILEGENGLLFVQNQRKWLNDNLAKYPKNKIQIDAIDAALRLYNAGMLKKEDGEKEQQETMRTGKTITMYKSGYRPLMRRLVKRINGEEMHFVYEISISWTPGMEYPVDVNITNYYAPIIVKPDKRINVQASKATEKVENTFALSTKEWCNCMRMIETNRQQFEIYHARDVYKDAEDAQRRNLAETQNKKEGRPGAA